jgi:hypothetical protein
LKGLAGEHWLPSYQIHASAVTDAEVKGHQYLTFFIGTSTNDTKFEVEFNADRVLLIGKRRARRRISSAVEGTQVEIFSANVRPVTHADD